MSLTFSRHQRVHRKMLWAVQAALGEVSSNEDASHCCPEGAGSALGMPCFLARAAKLAGRDDSGTAQLQLCARHSP